MSQGDTPQPSDDTPQLPVLPQGSKGFLIGTAIAVLGVVAALIGLAAWGIRELIVSESEDATTERFVALLVIVGVAALLLSAAVIAIRATFALLLVRSAPKPADTQFGLSPDDVIKVIPESLKAFGALPAAAMLAVVALACFAGAIAVVWEKFPDVDRGEEVTLTEPPLNISATATGTGTNRSCTVDLRRDTEQLISEITVGTYKVVLRDPTRDIALALTDRGVALAQTTRSSTGSFSFEVTLEERTLTALCVRGAKPPVEKPLKVVANG